MSGKCLRSMFASLGALRKAYNVPIQARNYSASVACKKLVFYEFGDPSEVVKLEEENMKYPNSDEVLVEMLVSSMNPADINTIQGTYPVKPPLPGVPGNEGVGQVVAVGTMVSGLNAGDFVIPNSEAIGTWRSHILAKESQLLKVPSDAPVVELAGISSNSSTAYRMLKDFVRLSPGDVVIQNGANSAAGQNVIQLCKIWGIQSVNVVRDRPDLGELKEKLTELGASCILTEEELRTTTIFKDGSFPAPTLGLNCVGGKSASEVMRKLAPKGTLVTYGGMSRQPVTIPTSLLIFKDIVCHGYWMTRWTRENRNSPERMKMLEEVISYMKCGQLKAPEHRLIPVSEYKDALSTKSDAKGFSGAKMILDFRA